MKRIGKILSIAAIFLVWFGWIVYVEIDLGIGSGCDRCWEKSLAVNLILFAAFAAVSIAFFRGFPTKLIVFFSGLAAFGGVLYALTFESVILALFLNPGPRLYRVLTEHFPEKISTHMDTTYIHQFPRSGYKIDIKRWEKYRRLKDLESKQRRQE